MKLGVSDTVNLLLQALAKAQDRRTAAVVERSVKPRRRRGVAPFAAAVVSSFALALCLAASQVGAQTFKVLHYFDGIGGANPDGNLLEASDGAFYGTTVRGGG